MNKQQVFEKLIQKGRTQSELDKVYNEGLEEAKQFGFNEEQQQTHALRKVIQSVAKKNFGGKQNTFEVLLFGVRKNDYGHTAYYKKAKTLFANEPETAIEQGMTDKDGNPLYKSGFQKGKPIDLNKVWEKAYIGLATIKDKNEFYPIQLKLTQDAFDQDLPMYKELEVTCAERFDTTKEMFISVNRNPVSYKITNELTDQDIKTHIVKHFSLVPFSSLREQSDLLQDKYDTYIAISGDVSNLILSEDGTKSHIVNLTDPEFDLDKIDEDDYVSEVTCWIDNSVPIKFADISTGVIAIGRPYYNEDSQQMNLNCIGIWAPSEFVIKRKLAEVSSEDTSSEEKKSDDSSEQGYKDWVE